MIQVYRGSIIEGAYLPSRTVKYAIKNLREKQVILEKSNLDDVRRKYYRFKGKICT